MSSVNNYAEETFPLFGFLQSEAFQFVIVRYNHYSLIQQLKKDLQARFPERPLVVVDAQSLSYRELMDTYYAMGSGFFFIENFGKLLEKPALYAGLNQRRDKLAQYPISLFALIEPPTDAHFARQIMEKIPDLWSFRSLVMDLKTSLAFPLRGFADSTQLSAEYTAAVSSLGGYTTQEKQQELKRLSSLLDRINPEDTAYLEVLYAQIFQLQKEIGAYQEALATADERLKYADSDQKSRILKEKAGIYRIIGDQDKLQQIEADLQQLTSQQLPISFQNKGTGLRQESPEVLIRAMYALSEAERALLSIFAVLPAESIPFATLKVLLAHTEKLDQSLRSLLQKGWLEASTTSFKTSPVIQEVTQQNNENLRADCQPLLDGLNEKLAYQTGVGHFLNSSYEEAALYARYGEKVVSSFEQADNDLALLCERLGNYHKTTGHLEKALGFFEDYNQLEKELYEAYPQNVEFKNNLAISYSQLGATHRSLGNLEKALGFFEDETQLSEELYEAYPQNVEFKNGLAISYEKLGDTHRSLGNLEKALGFFEDETQLFEELYEAYPQNVEFKNGLAISYANLGIYHQKLEHKSQAIGYFQAAEKLWGELVSAFPAYVQFQQNWERVKEDLGEL